MTEYERMKEWAEKHPEQYEEVLMRVLLEKHLETGPLPADLLLRARQVRVLERIADALERLQSLSGGRGDPI